MRARLRVVSARIAAYGTSMPETILDALLREKLDLVRMLAKGAPLTAREG